MAEKSTPSPKRTCQGNGNDSCCNETTAQCVKEEEEVEEISIGLDQYGRVVPAVKGPVDYSFRGFHNFIDRTTYDNLLADCDKVFTARATETNEQYSAGTTYFIRADETPKTAVEEFALDIFKHHAKGLEFDASKSGAEWWTLVIDHEDSDVGAHWDKDYGVESMGVNVFPNMSTVTYLSNVGAPTGIIPLVAPPHTHISLKESKFDDPSRVLVSKPVTGKHIVFDGRYFHFACSELSDGLELESTNAPQNTKRVSFLVNVWFNHVPHLAEALPTEVIGQLTAAGTTYKSAEQSSPVAVAKHKVDLNAETAEYFEEYLDENWVVRYWMSPVNEETSGVDLIELETKCAITEAPEQGEESEDES